MKRFILWDPSDGDPRRGDNSEWLTSGLLGVIDEGNVYLTVYPKYPDARRPGDLAVNERIQGVEYSLSGSKGSYDVYRIE